MVTKTEIDPNQKKLTEEQYEGLYEEAMAEYEGKEVQDTKESSEEKPEEKSEEKEEGDEDQNQEETEETEESEESEEESDEESEESEETKETKESEEGEQEEGVTEDQVREYALKYDLTESEAKEEIEKNQKTLEWYKNDPIAVARALRKQQSENDRLKQLEKDGEDGKEARQEAGSSFINAEQAKMAINKQVDENQEAVVNNFRKSYPAQSESMTDEAIVERVKDEAFRLHEVKMEKIQNKVSKEANEKRAQLLEGLDDFDKQFAVDVKKFLNDSTDFQIVSESFNVDDVLRWARGGKAKDLIKEAEDRGYKRGREEAKIIGEKTPVKPSDKTAKVKKSSSPLNDAQKARAESMFESLDGDNEAKYKLYRETYEEDLAKDHDFLG